jgi:hypothetical protein
MNIEQQYQLDQQYREQMLRAADNERLAQEAQATHNPHPIAAAVGRTMIKLGEKLQGEPEPHFVAGRKLEAR